MRKLAVCSFPNIHLQFITTYSLLFPHVPVLKGHPEKMLCSFRFLTQAT
jgi:hypothetical protein